ncbi:MAG: TetR/AcrR family transcriptional regulator [Polyangiaceae bacterium]
MADVLLAAATAAFGAQGFDAVRLEDVARAAGITRASLLYHYPSKTELYAAVVERAFAAMRDALERSLSAPGDSARGLGFEARLAHLVTALVAFEREHVDILSVVLRGCLHGGDAVAQRALEESLGPLVDTVEAAIVAGARVPRGFPVRAAVLQLMFAHLVHSAMGPLGARLWRGDAHTLTLARHLFVPNAAEPPRRPAKQRASSARKKPQAKET